MEILSVREIEVEVILPLFFMLPYIYFIGYHQFFGSLSFQMLDYS